MDWNKVDLVKVCKAARTVLVTQWQETNLGKIKFITNGALLVYVGLWWFDYNPPQDAATYLVIANCMAMYWPNIRGSLIAPVVRRAMTLVEIDDRNEIVTPYKYDESWAFFSRTPGLTDWYKANCRGFMGMMPQRPSEEGHRRTFWFTNRDDAFAFKMRWS